MAQGASLRAIGRRLRRAPSTISREIRRPKVCRLATRPVLPGVVAGTLAARWSPPQMAGWLRQTLPSDHERPVSHDTIYLSLFVQSRGVLRRALLTPLRRGRRCRHSRHATRAGQRREATARAAHHAFTIATRVQVCLLL